jgi:hypothetical protein
MKVKITYDKKSKKIIVEGIERIGFLKNIESENKEKSHKIKN